METQHEEAAPTFPTWRQRLEQANAQDLSAEIDRFLQVLKAVGTPMADETTVHFLHYDPEARRVSLTGEFNEWNRRGVAMAPLRETGIFYYTLEFREPTRVEYKFIVDGEWITDPFCPNTIDNGIGGQNSVVVIGTIEELPELQWVPTIAHGRVEEFDFASTLLNNRRRVYVYLPPGYDENPSQRFSTLYVHDGGEYLHRAQLATVLDNLLHSQDIPPLIAVMVDPVDRMKEYWTNEAYGRFVENEFVPYIEEHYRAQTQREGRGVMGASLGGLISTYLALSRPHLFAKAGGQSSAFFAEEEKIAALVEKLNTPIAFYLDVGSYEPRFIPAHHRLVPLLEAKGCPCFFQELTAGHNWTSWRAHLKDLLTFLWGTTAPVSDSRGRTEVSASARPQMKSDLPSPERRDILGSLFTSIERFLATWRRP